MHRKTVASDLCETRAFMIGNKKKCSTHRACDPVCKATAAEERNGATMVVTV